MKLSEILNKRRNATATVATNATVTPESMSCVAPVAGVAVENHKIASSKLHMQQRDPEKLKYDLDFVSTWLDRIGETNKEARVEVFELCKNDEEYRSYIWRCFEQR